MLRDSYTVFRREEKWNGVTPTNFDSFDMERLQYFVSLKIESWSCKGPFKYYVIMFLTFLDPPTHLFDNVILEWSLILHL